MGALGTFKATILLVAGAALGWLGSGLHAEFITLPAAREAGAQSERLVHEEQRRKAEAQADQDRRAAQVRIDAIERVYHERTAEQAAQLDILEASIAQEASHVQALPQAGGDACPAAVPRSLRDALARVGASAPGDRPADPPPALR